ncbi:SCO family protein [Candidatus Solirubrobacter pratensis]|uniref:SCO family protein n=1 Tax=Candidatus Solirubrobacter pratensis TaxID=1298857 RepID=UPI000427E81A|nr:SCO family protein [Candidatus Solirubrobacter pratensis]
MKRSSGSEPVPHADGRLRRLAPAILMCLILGALGGLLAATVYHPSTVRASFTPPREPARDFRLHDQDGRSITVGQARGHVVILTFLYSTCRDLCPAQAADIVQAVGKLGPLAGRVLVYGVSVDPVGDTPARARAFLKKYGVYGGPVHFLVGSRAALRPVWRAYGIVPINATPQEARDAAVAYDRLQSGGVKSRPYLPPERSAPPAAQEPFPDATDLRYRGRARHHAGVDFEHSAYVMLIDKRGIQRVGIPFEQLTPDSLAADLKRLLTQR